jgi:Tfp pilus assembly protein PilX
MHGMTLPRSPRGQVLVIVAVGLVLMVALVGLVIDGGYAWGQQRATQNATDATAEAGAVVLVQQLAGVTETDTDVWNAVQAVALANGYPPAGSPAVDPATDCLGGPPEQGKQGICAYYTDVSGNVLTSGGQPIAVGTLNGGAPPTGAGGVQAKARKMINTFLARAIGIDTFNITTPATAVAGYVSGVCDSDLGCAVLPVALPVSVLTCQPGQPGYNYTGDNYLKNTDQPYVIPLCSNSPGNVGWLDWTPTAGGTSELIQSIQNPDNPPIDVPSWQYVTSTGNVNSTGVEDAINAYDGQVVLIPQFDITCNTQPTGDPNTNYGCPQVNLGGTGQNQWYHLPQFAAFKLCNASICPAVTTGPDQHPAYTQGAYISGNNSSVCDTGNGATSCIAGYFVDFVVNTTVTGNVGANADTGLLGVQLIH